MAREQSKDFNAMLQDPKDMPKVQIITDPVSIAKYGGDRMYFAPPADYVTIEQREIAAQDIDLLGRMMSMQKAHETYALTGAICTMCAACIPDTLVWEITQGRAAPDKLRIGHPDGILHVGIDCTLAQDGTLQIREAYSYRTARMLMQGTAFS